MIQSTKKTAFINRDKELNYLSHWVQKEPENILFIFGPKSSGKTTLLMKFIENYQDHKNYHIKHFNLRKILIDSYINFIQAFFAVDYSDSKKSVKQKREYNVKVFKISKEIQENLENKRIDPFYVMEEALTHFVKKGKRPVIIIDELQALENIHMNGQRELLQELFNFFVSLTKESHLCHVIITSSDGYFMNKLYNESKLTKAAAFYEIDYLSENDVKYWLKHLEQESGINAYQLTDEQIDRIWQYLGGSMFEISYVLGELIIDASQNRITDNQLRECLETIVTTNMGKLKFYAGINHQKRAMFQEIWHILQEKSVFDMDDLDSLVQKGLYNEDLLTDELNNLVRTNILAFNPATACFQVQGNSFYYGLKSYIEFIRQKQNQKGTKNND